MVTRALMLAWVVSAAACRYQPGLRNCEVRCTAATGCPSGFSCAVVAGLCQATGGPACTPADAASDAPTDAALEMASCMGLAATCGPTGSSSCCESPVVTGGSFFRDQDVGSDGAYPDTSYPATVSTFRLDKFEVTVGRFRAFVAAGQGTQLAPPSAGAGANPWIAASGWDPRWNGLLVTDGTQLASALACDPLATWTDSPQGNETRPINCVTWYEAVAFCAWDGGFLPTSAEWAYAAAGGNEQRAYPWSVSPSALTLDDSSYASYWVNTTKTCYGDMMNGCAVTDFVSVGSKPMGDGKWGQSDLAGNVEEWLLDADAPYAVPCDDCAELDPTAAARVARGGAYDLNAAALRPAAHDTPAPSGRFAGFGFRCARSP